MAGATSFHIPGCDPASAAYAYLITYENGGYIPRPTPVVGSIDQLTAYLNANFPGWYVDTNNGHLHVPGVGEFRPDWAVMVQLPDEAKAYWKANRDPNTGCAFYIQDANGDGKQDVWFLTETTMQILYAV